EHESGLLLKMSGLIWGSRALGLRTAAPSITEKDVRVLLADVKPDIAAEGDKFVRLQEASINDLAGRSMSQETRDIFHSVRDFLASAAKELAEREQTAIEQQIAIHNAWIEDESQPA